MANKFDTEIITDAEVVEVDFNPLDEAVNEKKYTQPNVTATSIDINTPISEPTFTPPPFQKKAPKPEEQKKREPLNSELKDLPKKDKEMSAKAAAKMILQGYEWIHTLANKGLQVSEKKLNKLQQEGEINLNALIDYEYGKRMSAGEFFEEYNRQVEGVLVVTEEFKEEVTPVLERVLEKRGIGLTDEQTLMFMFGKDIAAKSLIFFQQRQVLNNMIENIKLATMQQQRQFQAQQQQFQAQYQPQPQYQQPQPQQAQAPQQQTPQQQAPPSQEPIVQAEPKDAGSYEFTKEYQEEQFVAKSKKPKKDGEVVVLPEPKKRRKKI